MIQRGEKEVLLFFKGKTAQTPHLQVVCWRATDDPQQAESVSPPISYPHTSTDLQQNLLPCWSAQSSASTHLTLFPSLSQYFPPFVILYKNLVNRCLSFLCLHWSSDSWFIEQSASAVKLRHHPNKLSALSKSCILVVNNVIVLPQLLQTLYTFLMCSEKFQYLILRYSLSAEKVQWNCTKCIFPKLRYEPGNTNKRKQLLASRARFEENKRSNFLCRFRGFCLFTLIWLYSALPDSLLTGLVSGLGFSTWRRGLEIGRPVTLMPSEIIS